MTADGHHVDHCVMTDNRFETVFGQQEQTKQPVDDALDGFRSSGGLYLASGDFPVCRLDADKQRLKPCRIDSSEAVEVVGRIREAIVIDIEVPLVCMSDDKPLH